MSSSRLRDVRAPRARGTRRRLVRPLVAATAFASLSMLAAVANVGDDVLVFDDFSDIGILNLNGEAAPVDTPDGRVLRIVPDEYLRAGSFFSIQTVNADSFSSAFSFRISSPGGGAYDCNDADGADGIVFVVQAVSSDLGASGGDLGYGGIERSVGVEFDCWCNTSSNDPSESHVGVLVDGSVVHSPDGRHTAPVEPPLDDGRRRYAWVDYDGTTLRVYLSDEPVQPFQPIVERVLDVPAILGQGAAYVGFTSGTGASWADHDVIEWAYTPYEPVCVGDFNGDRRVDGADVTILLAAWGGDLAFYDLSGDDVVSGADVTELLGRWGPCSP